MRKVVLSRARIQAHRGEPGTLDVTSYSKQWQAKAFATSGLLENKRHRGSISVPLYIESYRRQLASLSEPRWKWLYKRGEASDYRLNLLCYCSDGRLCHTYYAIKYATEHERWSKGFEAHEDLVEFVEGLDWEGTIWEYRDPVRLRFSS